LIDLYDDYSTTSSLHYGLADLFSPEDPIGDGGGTIESFTYGATGRDGQLETASIIGLAREYIDFLS